MSASSSSQVNATPSWKTTRFPNTAKEVWFERLKPDAREQVNKVDSLLSEQKHSGAFPLISPASYSTLKESSRLYKLRPSKNGGLLPADTKSLDLKQLPDLPILNRGFFGEPVAARWLNTVTPMTSEYTSRPFLLHQNPSSSEKLNTFLVLLKHLKIGHVVTCKEEWEAGMLGRGSYRIYNLDPGEERVVKPGQDCFGASPDESAKLAEASAVILKLVGSPEHILDPNGTQDLPCSFLTKRTFQATYPDGSTHTFTQTHIRGWQDREVVDLNPLLRAVANLPDGDAPIAVHCEGGNGRAGTFTTVAVAADHFREKKELPPFARLYVNLRCQRNIVETVDQLNLAVLATEHLAKDGLGVVGSQRTAYQKYSEQHESGRANLSIARRAGVLLGACGMSFAHDDVQRVVGDSSFCTDVSVDFTADQMKQMEQEYPEAIETMNIMVNGLSESAKNQFFSFCARNAKNPSLLQVLVKAAKSGYSLLDLQAKIPRTNGIYHSDEELVKHVGFFGLLWIGEFDEVIARVNQILDS